jgi:hypothetical protein
VSGLDQVSSREFTALEDLCLVVEQVERLGRRLAEPRRNDHEEGTNMKNETLFTLNDDSNPLLRHVMLKRPEDFEMGTRPTVSLHLLVKNGESCVGRLLSNVGPYIDEIVAVVNDTTDRTVEILRAYAELRGSGFNLIIVEVTAENHPELYILDVPETYQQGQPIADENYEGPFSGKPLLADWAGIRNLGWSKATKDWRLFLDADDVVQDPETIPGLCVALDEVRCQMACSRYLYHVSEDGKSRSDSYRERLVKNVPEISWVGITHEVLKGQLKTAHIDGNLIVSDLKDSLGVGIRVPGRCFKILYHHARSNGWQVSPRTLIYIAMEAKTAMPELAAAVLELYLEHSLWPEERAWACCMRGEIHERKDEFEKASEWYGKSLEEHPGSKAAFRLCRSKFHEGKWQEAIDAYRTGLENKIVLQLLDNGPAYEDMSKILVTSAYDKLDKAPEALAMCEEALKAFPHNTGLKVMHTQLRKGT